MMHAVSKIFLLSISFVFFTGSFAGQFVGNGGLVLQCAAGSGRPGVSLLDTYEATDLRGLKVDFGDESKSETEMAAFVFKRLSKLDPERSKRFAKKATHFFKEAVIVKGIPLSPSEDAGKVVLPDWCTIAQAAVQTKPDFPGDPVFVIDEKYWSVLTKTDRAALIVHEIIFNELLNQGNAKTSASTRYWVGLIASNSLQRFENIEVYIKALRDSGFSQYNGVPFSLLKSISYDKSAKIYAVNCLGAQPQKLTGIEVKSDKFCTHLSRAVRSLSVGSSHACAIENRVLRCWGSNVNGQLNIPVLRDPYLVSAADSSNCAADADGLKCWGNTRYFPTPEMKDVIELKSNLGQDFCASNFEGVECWGNGGLGTIAKPASTNVTSLAVSGWGACANAFGYASCTTHGSSSSTGTPPAITAAAVLDGGKEADNYCALQNGQLSCWGQSENWFDKSPVPLTNVSHFSMGNWHSCAVSAGKLGCWGSADFNAKSWKDTPDLKDVYLLSAGDASNCAATKTGIKCWGENESGEASP